MHKNHNKQPKKDVLSKLLSSKRASREINLPEDFHLSVMENLSGRLDGIGDMEPVFYFQKRDLAAGTVAARSIEAECREIYAVGRGYLCVCDRNIPNNNRRHLHLCFRERELLLARCSENSENGYHGVLMSRNPGDDLQDYQFFHRNKLVEPFSVDLKLGIYDVRFEDFFSLMFDFYGKSGLDW